MKAFGEGVEVGKFDDKYSFNEGFTAIDKKADDIVSESSDTKQDEVPSIFFFTLFRYATAGDKFKIFIAFVCTVVGAATTPFEVLLLAMLLESMVEYERSIADGNPDSDAFLNGVLWFAIYNVIIGLILLITTYVSTIFMNMAAYNQVYRIRQAFLKAALNQDFAYFDLKKNADIASKINSDLVKLEDGIGEKIMMFVFFQVAFISTLIMAFIKGWKLTLLCLISAPVSMVLVGVAEWVASKYSKKETIASGKAGAVAEEVLSAIRTVYAFCGQQKEIERYEVHLQEARRMNMKKGIFTAFSMGALFFCIFSSYGLSIYFGYWLMQNDSDNYNISTMIAVFLGVMTASGNFGMSSTLMEAFGISRGAGAQIFNVIDNVPAINPLLNQGMAPSKIDGNVELRNVKFHYPSRPDVPVLKGVTISVKRGQSAALVGHSGCGKSTIIQLISRYYDVEDGDILVDGNDVRDVSVQWLRAQIGLVGQEPVLFNTTVRENIRYGREDATDEDIEMVARQANAHEFIMKLPNRYDTLVGEKGASMSGGQKQRIAIARALVRNPSILLLDEATSALDNTSEAKVQRALDKAAEGRTTIIVAHRLSTIRNVDVIYVFKEGVVVETGNHEQLLQLKGHYYDMVMMQVVPSFDDDDNNDSNQLTRQNSVISEKDEDDELALSTNVEKTPEESNTDVSLLQILRLNSPEWKSITIASISAFLSGFALPLFAVVFGDFVEILVSDDEEEVMREIKKYAFIFVGIGIYSGISQFIMVYGYAIAGEFLTERLRKLMFEKFLQQEVAFFDDKENSTGALCSKLSGEAAAVQGATGQRIGSVLTAIGTLGLALALALAYEWRVGLVALAFVPIFMFAVYKEGKMTYMQSFGTAKTMENSSKIAVEAVANVRTLASLGREKTFVEEYAKQLQPALILAKRATHWRGVVFGLSRSIFNFILASSMYYGAVLIINDGVSFGDVYRSAQALIMGASSAAQAFAFAPNFQKGLKAAGRIILLLKRESKITDPAVPAIENFKGTGQSSFQNVHFKYPTRPTIRVLNDLNLEVEKGKTVALVGQSGCGKSTVIQLLERYYDTDSGIVAQDGIPLPGLRLADFRYTIGFVQQEPILFDRTIAGNIAYGNNQRAITMDEIIKAAKQANIHNFVTSLPMGYDTNIGSKGTQLSGGQKQRVAIARALIRRPQMLLLDEATSALDTESEKVVQKALDKAKAGRTCVMIAHRLSTVRDADVICVIQKGFVAERGTHTELMEQKGLYYNLNKRGYS